MGPLSNRLWERFAQNVARGDETGPAALAAGYKTASGHVYDVARKKDFISRVAEVSETIGWSGTQSVAPLLDILKREVEDTAKLKTAAGKRVVLDMLSMAAGLKKRLPPDPLPASAKPVSITLSPEEWSRQFSPRG